MRIQGKATFEEAAVLRKFRAVAVRSLWTIAEAALYYTIRAGFNTGNWAGKSGTQAG